MKKKCFFVLGVIGGYTILFWLLVFLGKYLLPLYLGVAFLLISSNMKCYLEKKYRINHNFLCVLITFMVYIIIFSFLYMLLLFIYKYVLLGVNYFTQFDFKDNFIYSFINNYYDIDSLSIESSFSEYKSYLFDVMKKIMSYFTCLPAILLGIITTFVSSFVFLKHSKGIKDYLATKLNSLPKKVSKVIDNTRLLLKKFIISYLIIYSVTFAESLIIFFFLGINDAVLLSFITVIADFLPIVGPGTIYVIIALLYFANGNIIKGVIILICWIITIIVRQILEPKIMSSRLRIHPLYCLISLYIALVIGNILMFFYLIFLYLVLISVGIFKNKSKHS